MSYIRFGPIEGRSTRIHRYRQLSFSWAGFYGSIMMDNRSYISGRGKMITWRYANPSSFHSAEGECFWAAVPLIIINFKISGLPATPCMVLIPIQRRAVRLVLGPYVIRGLVRPMSYVRK